MRFQSYLNTSAFILETYDGSAPLVHHLKHYFAQFKKHGSKDRKFISHLCYCYFRLGNAVENIPIAERIKLALFLCNNEAGAWASLFEEEWIHHWSNNATERIAFAQQQYKNFDTQHIFSWQDELSESIDVNQFALSHLIQPYLFLRLRPGYEKTIIQRLRDVDIPFQKVATTSLALANGTKLDDVIRINEEAVVQDLSSQTIATFITPELIRLNWHQQWKVWDCCAASGGKTLLLYDIHNNSEFYLSDVRESMQHQLKQRLDAAHIHHWKFATADLTEKANPFGLAQKFNFIIADVPCTGSGTWARTPEQIHYFKKEIIEQYASTQKRIVSNVVSSLNEDGYFLYITCSVFKKENEEVANYIKQNFHLQLIKMEVIKGYDLKADTMFAALFKKVTA
jgi:16S rRNA (cytosine967-C5)-methyltransferase